MSILGSKIVPASEVILVGGSPAHLETIHRYGTLARPPFRLSLISEVTRVPHRGMVGGLISQRYRDEEVFVDLGHLCEASRVKLILASPKGLDPSHKKLALGGPRRPVSFDALSIGVEPSVHLPDWTARLTTLATRPLHQFLWRLDELDERVAAQPKDQPLRIVVMGDGLSSIELCLALSARWSDSSRTFGKFHMTLLEEKPQLAPKLSTAARKALQSELNRCQVGVYVNTSVVEHGEGSQLILTGSRQCPVDLLLWDGPPRGPTWLEDSPIARSDAGFVTVKSNLESQSHEMVYAVDDSCSHAKWDPTGPFPSPPAPMGSVLAENLERRFLGLSQHDYHPVRPDFFIMTTQPGRAIVSWKNHGIRSRALWYLKDHWDRDAVHRFQRTPRRVKVSTYVESGNLAEPPCRGGGSRLPADLVANDDRETSRTPQTSQGSISPFFSTSVTDLSTIQGMESCQTKFIQSHDYLRCFHLDLHQFAQLTVIHCLNNIYAAGHRPHSAHGIVTVPFGPKPTMKVDLNELADGFADALHRCGVTPTGLHSQAGPEAGLGLAVQSYSTSPSWHATGLGKDMRLVITKPLGVGILLAGHIRYRVSTQHLQQAYEEMMRPHEQAVEVARSFSVETGTPITGHGLAWQLGELSRHSGVSIDVELRRLPIYSGAFSAMAAGIRSSLHAQNRLPFMSSLQSLSHEDMVLAEAAFDPQTSGGLILAIAEDRSEELVHALREAGFQRAVSFASVREASHQNPPIRFI